MKNQLFRSLIIILSAAPILGIAQSNNEKITGQNDDANPITVAVPFISFAPDSRSSAMGDAGVASSPDAYSSHWNSAKLAFIETDIGGSLSYSPWLGKIINDMSLNYLTFYSRIDQYQTFGASVTYFDLGEFQVTDESGNPGNLENPSELAIDGSYARKLSETMSIGVTGRFIWSNLSSHAAGSTDAKDGISVAVDIGYYFKKPVVLGSKDGEFSFGANLSNFGQKINYSNETNEDFIPTNLRLGTALKTQIDPYNSITLMVDFNKLMVPTPPEYQYEDDGVTKSTDPATGEYIILDGKDPDRSLLSGTFGSFADAPGGFSEEIQEVMVSVGAEYMYQELFALRAGYFAESKNKGDRKYFTMGLGFKYQVIGIDFSYLVSQEKDHPLGDTIRLSLQFNIDKD